MNRIWKQIKKRDTIFSESCDDIILIYEIYFFWKIWHPTNLSHKFKSNCSLPCLMRDIFYVLWLFYNYDKTFFLAVFWKSVPSMACNKVNVFSLMYSELWTAHETLKAICARVVFLAECQMDQKNAPRCPPPF